MAGPRVARDTVLVLADTRTPALSLVALDAATGEERWRQPASPGEIVTGIPVQPHVVGDRAVWFRPAPTGNLYAELVVADPSTGDEVAVSEPMLFGGTPDACGPDGTQVCVRARATYEDSYRWMRLDPATDAGLVPHDPDTGLPEGSRLIGAGGLVDLGGRDPELLAVVEDGQELWRRPVEEVFGRGHSTDGGWWWRYDEDADLLVGTVGTPTDDVPAAIDLGDGAMAGLRRSTGEVLWVERGVDPWCSGVLEVPAEAGSDGHDTDVLPLSVRCRATGRVVLDPEGEADPRPEDVDVVLEGFDPRTGETTWSVPLGDDTRLLGDWLADAPLVRRGATGLVVEVDGEPTVVDLVDGRRTAPPGVPNGIGRDVDGRVVVLAPDGVVALRAG